MSAAPPPRRTQTPVKIDPKRTHPVLQLRHNSPLIGCRIDPTGESVFAGASGQRRRAGRHLASSKQTVLAGHKGWVRARADAASGKQLLSRDWAGRIIAWPVDAETPAPRWNIAAHRGWVRALAVGPDGKTLASCGNDHLVKLWSIPDGKPVRDLDKAHRDVYNVAFHPDGRALVSADLKGIVKVWDLAKGVVAREMDAKILHKYDNTFGADIGGVQSHGNRPRSAPCWPVPASPTSTARFAGVGEIRWWCCLTGRPAGKKQLLRPEGQLPGHGLGRGPARKASSSASAAATTLCYGRGSRTSRRRFTR